MELKLVKCKWLIKSKYKCDKITAIKSNDLHNYTIYQYFQPIKFSAMPKKFSIVSKNSMVATTSGHLRV